MTWTEILAPIKNTEYFTTLWEKVKQEYATTKVFPPKSQIFRALEITLFDEVEVVIIGQDPYHNDYQANGLCFSVSEKVVAPPSLKNIFIELKDDLGVERKSKERIGRLGKAGCFIIKCYFNGTCAFSKLS
jgi:Uracil DNA glycosylase